MGRVYQDYLDGLWVATNDVYSRRQQELEKAGYILWVLKNQKTSIGDRSDNKP